ncbi:hypothetical protein B9Z55_015891 [Caenorhabditis nigoni]|uniref:Sdz-33 F-box domain-containing protein n=1 Tax=Caenorhabditis nigoni TaxID=1611254 RepID=A0A2G5UCB7_9PELO|nr:hypothetical protein B9Z55_015891 [Caenorhabditis nigoni]
MPFPILRSSFVVLSEIISLLEPNEIVTASFCSKNVKRLLKRHYQRRKPSEWRLNMIDCQSHGRVEIAKICGNNCQPVLLAKHTSDLKECKSIEINGYKKGFASKNAVIHFENRVMGLKTIVDYAANLFSLDVHGILIDRNGNWAIDWINNRQETLIDYSWVDRNGGGDKELNYVLRNARASDNCAIEGSVSENFRFNGNLGPMRRLYILKNGHWVTLNNLIDFDVMSIFVKGSRISVSDIYSFLRHWRAGGSSRLKFLKLEFENDTVFGNFEEEVKVVKRGISAGYRLQIGGERHFHFDNGYGICGNGGRKALIQFEIRHFVIIVLNGK